MTREQYVSALRNDPEIHYADRVCALVMFDYHEVLSAPDLVAELVGHPSARITERRAKLALERLAAGGHLAEFGDAGQHAPVPA
jgi:hypothetical protein